MFGFFKRKKAPAQQPATASERPLRDYLAEASSLLNTPRPLRQLLMEDRDATLNNLVNALSTGRKAAAYALGQIGDPRALPALHQCLAQCRVRGDSEALVAAITAINIASEGTELERQKIIGAVYNGKMRPQLQKW